MGKSGHIGRKMAATLPVPERRHSLFIPAKPRTAI
jgi:D-arabinose 5-phosphate isomerase GutQ